MILTYNNKWLYKGSKVLDKDNVVPPQPTIYYVTTSGVGGSVVANPTSGVEGTEVSLSNTPNQGYQFNSYSVSGATLKSSNKFDIEQSNVNVVGNFDRIYNVNVTQSTGGSISASPTQGLNGTQVTLSNTPSQGYTFGNYNVTGATLNNNKFTINNSDVNVSATFNKIYNVSVTQPTGGSISASPLQGINGTTVTLSNTPNQGYQFNKYVVSGATLYNGNKFNINGSNVSVTAQFNTIPASALLVNLGTRTYQQTSLGTQTIELTGMPTSSPLNYLTFVMEAYLNYGNDVYNATDLYLRNSSNGIIWRIRSHIQMTDKLVGFVGITGATKSWTSQSGTTIYSSTVNSISYRNSPTWASSSTSFKPIKFVFDRNAKKGYFYINNTLMGYATLNVDAITINNIGLQVEQKYANGYRAKVRYIKVAGFNTLSAAQAWNG